MRSTTPNPSTPLQALVERAKARSMMNFALVLFIALLIQAVHGRSSRLLLMETLVGLLLNLADQHLRAFLAERRMNRLTEQGYKAHIVVGFERPSGDLPGNDPHTDSTS